MKKKSLILLFLLSLALTSCKINLIDTDEGKENNEKAVEPSATPASIIEEESFVTVEDVMPCVSDYSQYSNKVYGFGFKKTEKGKIPSAGVYENYLKGNEAVFIGDTSKKNIYLTFDEGYENGYTAKILDTLKEKNVPAAFFCTGDYIKKNPDLILRMINEGHIIGNHTWNHPTLPNITEDTKFKSELTKIDDYLYEKHGIKTKYFRYPNGEFSEKSLKMVKDMGYKTVFWSLAYKDWERDVVKGTDYAVGEVVNHIHNGAIILLHAVSRDNAEALKTIIEKLTQEGYIFDKLENLKF